MRTRSLVLAALVCLFPLHAARAGSNDAWTAAKANLPKDTMVLLGLDLAQLQKSSLWSLGFPLILSQQPDIKAALDTVKASCQLDPLKIITGLVIGTDANQQHGAIYISVTGLDQAKLTSCFQVVAKGKPTIKTEGKITELSSGDKTLYLSWIGTNVLVLPFELGNKADLGTWTAGAKALTKSKVARSMGKVNTSAAVWAVSAVPKDLDDNQKMKGGYGAIT